MNCPLRSEETTDVLLDYAAGRLDTARAAMLEQHLESCSGCAAFRMEQSALWDALSQWEPEPVSIAFNRTLWQKIGAAAAAPWHRRFADAIRFGAWKPAFPLLAAVMLIAVGFVYDHPGSGNSSSSQSVSATLPGVSISDADQVEKTLDDIQLLRQFDAVSSGTSKRM